MSVDFNKWLSRELPTVNEFIVDKSKENYYIKYYETEKLTLALNDDWQNVKKCIDEVKNNIREINEAIDSEDYQVRSTDVMKAIEESTSALDENFTKLFYSVVKRMDESAESDEWFSENAKKYSSNILGAIIGMGASATPLSNSANNYNLGQQSNSPLNYEPSPIPAQDTSSSEPVVDNIAAYTNGEPIPSELKYGPSLENGSNNSSIDGSSPSYFAADHKSKMETPVSEASSQPEVTNYSSEETQTQPEVTNYSVGEGRTIDIPDSVRQTGLCPNYTGYDKFYGKWSKGTMQRELSEQWGAAGKPSSNGIATLNDRYLVAVSPKFGRVGDNIDIVLKDGQVIKATIADSKGKDATSEWGHVLTKSGAVDIIEWEASGPKSEINLGSWRNVGVDKIVNLTN